MSVNCISRVDRRVNDEPLEGLASYAHEHKCIVYYRICRGDSDIGLFARLAT